MFKKIKKKILVLILETIIDLINDVILSLKTGSSITPFKVEKDEERDNPVSVNNTTNSILNKIFK